MMIDRLSLLKTAIMHEDIDAIICTAGINLVYLTGLEFHISERPVFAIFHRECEAIFVIPFLERLKAESRGIPTNRIFTYTDEQGPALALEKALAATPATTTVGVEYLNMRVMEFTMLNQVIPGAGFSDAGIVIDRLRLHKSPLEIASHKMAVKISEEALKKTLSEFRPGLSERDVALKLSQYQRSLGGGREFFEPIVLGGPNSANPHGVPGDYRFKENDVILIDFGTSYEGFVSDITRTFFIGTPTTSMRDAYEVVQKANRAGRDAVKPGITCSKIDESSRDVIERSGLGKYFTHRTGHGIGMDIHEKPYIINGNVQPLEKGMVFTIEPGVYFEGQFGIRIEDDVVVTDSGLECLSSFSRDLTIL